MTAQAQTQIEPEVDFTEELGELEIQYEFIEAASEVDGKHILAKVRGIAAPFDVASGNNNAYSREAFVNAISRDDFQRRLGDRLIFGSIGHDVVMDDKAVREGLASHIISDAFVKNDHFGAEYLILGTPSGIVLNTLLRAKSRMRVSIKAKGIPLMNGNLRYPNPDTFIIERIDFVCDPGFQQALPDIVESIQPEAPALGEPLTKKVNEMETPTNEFNEHLKATNSTLTLKIVEMEESLVGAKATIAQFQTAGFANYDEALAAVVLLKQYQEIGTVEEMQESIIVGEEALEEAGLKLTQMQEALEAAGDIEGTKTLMVEMKESLAGYAKIGTLEEINNVVDALQDTTKALLSTKSAVLATKFGVDQDYVEALVNDKGFTLAETAELLGKFHESAQAAAKVEVKEPAAKAPGKGLSTENFRESAPGKTPIEADFVESHDGGGSLVNSLMNIVARVK